MSKIQDSLETLQALGFACIPFEPKSKACKIQDWVSKSFSTSDFHPNSNIAVRLDDGFVDIDLDCDEAAQLAPHILPPTDCIWGRLGRPQSHWIYKIEQPAETKSFNVKAGPMIVEFRTGKHATLAPGSTHPNGEAIEYCSEGPPASVDPKSLLQLVKLVAACTVILRESWSTGSHHKPAMGFIGVLAKAGYSESMAQIALDALVKVSTGVEKADMDSIVKSTYQRLASGTVISGISLLKDSGLPEACATAISKWLPSTSTASQELSKKMEQEGAPIWGARFRKMSDFLEIKYARKEAVLGNWLHSNDSVIIYGAAGHGKSLASMAMANAISRAGTFGSHRADTSRRVAIIDGELPPNDLQSMAKKFDLCGDILIVSSGDFLTAHETPDISNPHQQNLILAALKQHCVEVVFFDNLFSLAMIQDFNSNDDPGVRSLTKFMTRLRAEGITAIFVHHSTKTGKGFAGATRLEVHVDLTIRIERSFDVFRFEFQKHRGRPSIDPFSLELLASQDAFVFEDVDSTIGASLVDWTNSLLTLVETGFSVRKAAEQLGWSKSTVQERIHKLSAMGLVEKIGGKFRRTPAGEEWLVAAAKTEAVAKAF